MYKHIIAIALATTGTFAMGSNAYAQSSSVSLTTTAARSAYNLQWLLPERAVTLYRPGLVIVIRPGEREYEVNSRVEFADAPPAYVNGDLLISASLASRLKRLASMAYVRPASSGARSAEAPATASGPITVDARQLQGSEAVSVNGRAPSGAPVTLTLLATISPDLPTVVVSRHDVQPDANGQFAAVISIASDYLRGSILRVV
ncbi:MAG TPA: hypothetical protein VJP85_14470, partial [Candidatus Baltobacteraceae bacterium]|nr:hypothetical protein [Candidatus Baltobacteraceae bacterium]